MATFKKFDNQQVYQLDASGAVFELAVGDVISYDESSKTATKVTSLEGAKTAIDGGLELYLVAQSDAVTYKHGKGYKSYRFDESLEGVISDNGSTIVAYRIETLSNIEGLPPEDDEVSGDGDESGEGNA